MLGTRTVQELHTLRVRVSWRAKRTTLRLRSNPRDPASANGVQVFENRRPRGGKRGKPHQAADRGVSDAHRDSALERRTISMGRDYLA